ncbi:tripartite tricarboxylate transporter TctB family protein [Sphaerochaeta halotolerans]|jgi:hypothetical protein|uniref:tripartite tricarboxylate transporter TctB family protein n=1 Tax=Sphaerochaeta halotolerans TaxID=2293840 RepID=UPI00136E075F|nr:tripartite tricarboxylate transporter TctB family protein [Sphaerochaeta halotolerans]MDN5334032.1 hypothetical protein [Sphaerochaeta sp.]MXI86982.1 tripartite tricarboxylate transporter TctB family protein [Sphaerochaeta halotolerans]
MKIYGDVVFGIVSFILSTVFLILAQRFSSATTDGVPGAGFFPSIVCVLIMFISVLLIIQGYKKKQHYFKPAVGIKELSRNTRDLIITCLALIGFFLLWKYVHFLVGITLFLLILNAVYRQKILTNIIYTLVCASAIYFVFGKIFHVML